MKNFIKHAAVGIALSVPGAALAEAAFPVHADASAAFICKDANGGSIDNNDFDIAKLQTIVGVTADGNFGPKTCENTVLKMREVGLVSNDTTNIRVGVKTLTAFGLLSNPVDSVAPATSTPENTNCPVEVKSSNQISKQCRTLAAKLISDAGYYNIPAYQAINGIPFTEHANKIGPKTYNLAMKGANLNITSPDLRQHVEVDMSDRIATYFNKGKAVVIARTSTGSGKTYTYTKNGETKTSQAITPLGKFKVLEEKDANYKSGDLGGKPGSMAYGERITWSGVFLHTGKMTAQPGSHGCVRIDGSGEGDDALKIMRDAGFGPGDSVIIHE
jgi:lipoprotein-anchoring transpeptidase ErfK/SrfK